jgi:hypothetical protein
VDDNESPCPLYRGLWSLMVTITSMISPVRL